MNTSTKTIHDGLACAIEIGDVVTVIGWGRPVRLIDCGRKAEVVGFTAQGNILLNDTSSDPIAGGRAVGPSYLAVARRDGLVGHQGNVGRDRT